MKIYNNVIKFLKDASPSDPNLDDKMVQILGTHGPPKNCKDARLANPILDQVAHEFAPQIAALEPKWGHDALEGFRDPLGAGHGPPLSQATPGPSDTASPQGTATPSDTAAPQGTPSPAGNAR